jgi:hypothetical protein
MNNKLPKVLSHSLLLLGFVAQLTSLLPLRCTHAAEQSLISAVAVRVEYQTNPVAIDSPKPRFSWQVRDERRGAVQTSYQIQVARTEGELRAGRFVWDSGKVSSGSPFNVSMKVLRCNRRKDITGTYVFGTLQVKRLRGARVHPGKWVYCNPRIGRRAGSNPT